MCAISGAFAYGSKATVDQKLLASILKKAQERGRDSVGIYTDKGQWRTYQKEPVIIPEVELVALANNRAEPTTEYVAKKSTDDVQPYQENQTLVVHNGTIANDKEITKKFNFFEEPNIDSKILPRLLDYVWDGSLENLVVTLTTEIIGSYAMAIYREDQETLFLAANYKPIYYELISGVLYFSSLDKFLPGFDRVDSRIRKLEPYSVMQIDKDRFAFDSLRNTPLNDKALVVCSGGLDSTVVATELKRKGYEVTLLHFKYKARSEDRELEAIRNIASYLEVKLLEVETDMFKEVIKHSRLTNTNDDLVTERKGEASAELAHEWVPARNLIMLSIALGIAEANEIHTIALGNNLEEAGAYADNEQEFVYQFNKLIPNAINLNAFVRVVEPVGNLMKHEIVAKGLKINAPLHLTWSCYNNGKLHCGTCGPCYMRRKAFEMNNAKEVIQYAS